MPCLTYIMSIADHLITEYKTITVSFTSLFGKNEIQFGRNKI